MSNAEKTAMFGTREQGTIPSIMQ